MNYNDLAESPFEAGPDFVLASNFGNENVGSFGGAGGGGLRPFLRLGDDDVVDDVTGGS